MIILMVIVGSVEDGVTKRKIAQKILMIAASMECVIGVEIGVTWQEIAMIIEWFYVSAIVLYVSCPNLVFQKPEAVFTLP